jgi:iron only hydrogenase large subunit-like protein/uncharacterized Fe-S cluster-containing protein
MTTDTNVPNKSGMQNTIYTVTASCQDCYRCLRACPVKAIRVTRGQAFVEDALCIKCGTCVRECPQQAKTIHSSLEAVKKLLAGERPVVASVAPSFPAVFRCWRALRLPAALRLLGFAHVTETAEGADRITEASFKHAPAGSICTACPAVVNYIELYRPDYVDLLIPVLSPMVAHGKMLKERYGSDCAVVFIGPCAAKKSEAKRPEHVGVVDEVLTFTELLTWLDEENIDLAACPESAFETGAYNSLARLFPLPGGMLKTGNIACDGTEDAVLHISGANEVMDIFSIPAREWWFRTVEPLFCRGGCINGPAFPREKNIYQRRSAVIEYAAKAMPAMIGAQRDSVSLAAIFARDSAASLLEDMNESQIDQILKSMGKLDPEARLNCGACGYKSCIDNAVAMLRGLAEPEMCMPYMRRLAQQRTDRVIETSPSGVVVLDSELHIINMNPAFQKMFFCNNSILGRRISYLVNADGYEKMLAGAMERYESIRTKYGIKYHELLYALRDEGQYVGMYTDISQLKFDEGQVDLLKRQTLAQAKELLDHQIAFSQEMAHYLGQSTARNEEFVRRLMSLYED